MFINKPKLKKHNKVQNKEKRQALLVARASNGLRLKKLTRSEKNKKEKIIQGSVKLPNAWRIIWKSLQQLYANKKLFLGILLIYGIFYVLFVRGINTSFNLVSLRQSVTSAISGKAGLSKGLALYGLLIGTSGSNSDVSSTYQTFLVIIVSLAIIWALRNTYSKTPKLKIKDSFYKSTYSLIPFMTICLIIVIQVLPALIVTSVYSIIRTNNLAKGGVQSATTILVLVLGILWSIYMISSSLFALYIVTLPDTGPIAALKSAKKLVKYRRLIIIRKVFFLPVILVSFSALVLVPLVLVLPIAAEILFMIFTIVVLAIIHSYFYTLYRSLLGE